MGTSGNLLLRPPFHIVPARRLKNAGEQKSSTAQDSGGPRLTEFGWQFELRESELDEGHFVAASGRCFGSARHRMSVGIQLANALVSVHTLVIC
jgi:hypothetical protein